MCNFAKKGQIAKMTFDFNYRRAHMCTGQLHIPSRETRAEVFCCANKDLYHM